MIIWRPSIEGSSSILAVPAVSTLTRSSTLEAEFLMRHFAAAEAQDELDLVAFLEEAAHGLHLGLVIMVVDAGAQLDFLDLDDLLLLAGLGGLLLLVEAEFAVIEDLADRRIGVGHDLDQIETIFLGEAQASTMSTTPRFWPSASIS